MPVTDPVKRAEGWAYRRASNVETAQLIDDLVDEVERLRTALAARPQPELLAEAIRGFLLEKHLPFSELDAWTDELVLIVGEHRAVAGSAIPTGDDDE